MGDDYYYSGQYAEEQAEAEAQAKESLTGIQQLRMLTDEATRFAETEGYVQSFVPRLARDWQSAYDQQAEQIKMLREALQEMRYAWTDKALRMADEALEQTEPGGAGRDMPANA